MLPCRGLANRFQQDISSLKITGCVTDRNMPGLFGDSFLLFMFQRIPILTRDPCLPYLTTKCWPTATTLRGIYLVTENMRRIYNSPRLAGVGGG
ncbi:hypothetical protein I7I48_05234 [Histoplasma ohiense]|nr:hypothetical protein I7I48_05234 [Histoplasma ohiense (nom. inval.)]